MKPEPSSSRKTFNCTHQIWADKRHPYHLSTSSSPPPQLFTLSGPWDLRWFSFNRKFNISSRSSAHKKRDLVNHTVTTSRGMSQIYAARITFDDLDVSPKKKSESSLSFNCLCHPVYSLHSSFGCKLIGSSSSSVYWWQLSFNSMSAFLVLSLTRGDNSIRPLRVESGRRRMTEAIIICVIKEKIVCRDKQHFQQVAEESIKVVPWEICLYILPMTFSFPILFDGP